MSKGAINFSSDNEYYTPKWLVDLFGKFDYDPATTKEKAEEFGVLHYDTIETDGLKADWTPYKRIWINPPFTIKHLFFKKAVDTFRATGGGNLPVISHRVSHYQAFSRGFGRTGRHTLPAERTAQVREWPRQACQVACLWQCGIQNWRGARYNGGKD